MMPGINARPSASMVSREAPRMRPTSTIFPSFTATPPRRGGEPRPSTSITSRIARSNIPREYNQRGALEREHVGAGHGAQAREIAQRDGAVADVDQSFRLQPLELRVHLGAAGAEHHREVGLRHAQLDARAVERV